MNPLFALLLPSEYDLSPGATLLAQYVETAAGIGVIVFVTMRAASLIASAFGTVADPSYDDVNAPRYDFEASGFYTPQGHEMSMGEYADHLTELNSGASPDERQDVSFVVGTDEYEGFRGPAGEFSSMDPDDGMTGVQREIAMGIRVAPGENYDPSYDPEDDAYLPPDPQWMIDERAHSESKD